VKNKKIKIKKFIKKKEQKGRIFFLRKRQAKKNN
jgi:hypothetical protein